MPGGRGAHAQQLAAGGLHARQVRVHGLRRECRALLPPLPSPQSQLSNGCLAMSDLSGCDDSLLRGLKERSAHQVWQVASMHGRYQFILKAPCCCLCRPFPGQSRETQWLLIGHMLCIMSSHSGIATLERYIIEHYRNATPRRKRQGLGAQRQAPTCFMCFALSRAGSIWLGSISASRDGAVAHLEKVHQCKLTPTPHALAQSPPCDSDKFFSGTCTGMFASACISSSTLYFRTAHTKQHKRHFCNPQEQYIHA